MSPGIVSVSQFINVTATSSHAAYIAGWWSEAITLLARLFATVEILHLVLISYRGIWGLAWRLLAATS